MRVFDKLELSADEVERFNYCSKYHQFSTSSIWKDICEHMDELVAEALMSMQGSVSMDDRVEANLKRRWQQRNAMAIAVKQYVQSLSDEYSDIKEKLNEEEPWQPQQ